MAKGDSITISTRTQSGAFTMPPVTARQNGRTVEMEWAKDGGVSWLSVKELTRGGTVVAEHRYAAADVVSVIKEVKE